MGRIAVLLLLLGFLLWPVSKSSADDRSLSGYDGVDCMKNVYVRKEYRQVHPRQKCFIGKDNPKKFGMVIFRKDGEPEFWSFNVGSFQTSDIAIPNQDSKPTRLTLAYSHTGLGGFEVHVMSVASGKQIDTLVTATGESKGKRTIEIAEPVYFDIFATGGWTLQVL